MSKYFENILNSGETIEIEILHNRSIIVQYIISSIICLIIAFILNIFANMLVKWLCDVIDTPSLDWLVNSLPTIKNVIIWGGYAFFGVIVQVIDLLQVFAAKLAITNRRVIGKVGLFGAHTLDYPIEKIDNVSVKTTFFGKIFHHSDIIIKSTNDAGIEFSNVTNANEFRNALTAAIAKNADEARKAQANEIANAMKNSN